MKSDLKIKGAGRANQKKGGFGFEGGILNRHIATDEVLASINQVFGLTAPKVHAEGSRHYECYIDKDDSW